MDSRRAGPGLALGAAVLFGLSAPAGKLLAGTVDPWLLAGLLYLGSGVGLGLYRLANFYYSPGFNKPNGTGECIVSLKLWNSLDAQQKRHFADESMRVSRERGVN